MFPALEQNLYRFAVQKELVSNKDVQSVFELPKEISQLTPDAKCIYEELKAAIERKNRRTY
jgi:hypothetical protein